MALLLPKEGATQEEINAWIIATRDAYDKMENDLQTKTTREQELLYANNELYRKVTTKKEEKEDDTNTEEIPSCIDEKMYKLLSEKDKAVLKELIEEEE